MTINYFEKKWNVTQHNGEPLVRNIYTTTTLNWKVPLIVSLVSSCFLPLSFMKILWYNDFPTNYKCIKTSLFQTSANLGSKNCLLYLNWNFTFRTPSLRSHPRLVVPEYIPTRREPHSSLCTKTLKQWYSDSLERPM